MCQRTSLLVASIIQHSALAIQEEEEAAVNAQQCDVLDDSLYAVLQSKAAASAR
jgi:hypothetical protein